MTAGIFVFGPVGGIIAAAIFLEERKDIFFRQSRIGRDGKEFQVLKFRTMTEGRVTKVGQWLRKTGLDELPQLLNVFYGDMSIVGPRPLTSFDVERLGWQAEKFRWRTKPGITGFAQIGVGAGAKASLAADRDYIERATVRSDLRVVCITFFMNVFGKQRIQRVLRFPNRRSLL